MKNNSIKKIFILLLVVIITLNIGAYERASTMKKRDAISEPSQTDVLSEEEAREIDLKEIYALIGFVSSALLPLYIIYGTSSDYELDDVFKLSAVGCLGSIVVSSLIETIVRIVIEKKKGWEIFSSLKPFGAFLGGILGSILLVIAAIIFICILIYMLSRTSFDDI